MLTEQEFKQLADSEDGITKEALLSMIAVLRKSHSDLEKEIVDFYNKYGTDGVVTYAEANKWISEKNHSRRLIALLFATKVIMDNTHRPIQSSFGSHIDNIILKQVDAFNTRVDVDKFHNYKWGTDEASWKTRLRDNFILWNAKLNVDIKQSIMKQDTLPQLLEKVDKRFKTMESGIKTLLITETTATTSKVRVAIYKELGYNRYRFYAVADERTCSICGELHGKEFPLSMMEVGVNAPSMHPRCRCIITPVK